MPAKLSIDDLIASLKTITVVDEFHELKRDAAGKIAVDGNGDSLWESMDRHPYVIKGEKPDHIIVSAEDGNWFANYYGPIDEGGDPWVHPLIEAWAKEHGYEVDWRDPGSLLLYPA